MIDLAEEECIGRTKGLKEAADNLYLILQKDKSSSKLEALAEALQNDSSKKIYQELAAMINIF